MKYTNLPRFSGNIYDSSHQNFQDLKNNDLKEYGRSNETYEGWTIIKEVYKLRNTFGLPLSEIFNIYYKFKCMPSWIDLYEEMIKQGIKQNRIINEIEREISDSEFQNEFAKIVCNKLRKLYEKQETV